MEAALFIYLASTLGSASAAVMFIFIISFVVIFGFLIAYLCHKTEYISMYDERLKTMTEKEIQTEQAKPFLQGVKVALKISAFAGITAVALPSERTMYLMAGAYLGQQALTSEVSKDLQDIVGLQVKKYKKELQEQVK